MLPHLHGASDYCPTLALLTFITSAGQVPPSAPALAYRGVDGSLKVLTPATGHRRLHHLLTAMGLTAANYGTHSLCRSGATHLFMAGVPIATIPILGDWKSDSIYKYLKPDPMSKLALLQGKFT